MKALLVLLSMLLATVASAQSISTGYLSGSAQPGFTLELTSANATGVYYIGPSAAMTFAEFRLASALRGTLYNCFLIDADTDSGGAGDGTVDASANCTPILGLSGNGSGAVLGGGRYLHIDIDTAESGTNKSILLIRGSNTLGRLSDEEMCEAGLQGFGYNTTTRRWWKTCGDWNWPGWRDSTQMTASYTIACTAEGAPHESCQRSGDVVYKGYWMRMALAAEYTADGGTVIALPHPYEIDGAGLLQDGVTRAKFPQPFDPEWEARPEFSQLGYPTYLMGVKPARGVTIVGLGTPSAITYSGVDPTITWATPKFVGSFLRDNYGASSGGFAGTPINDGPNSNMTSPDFYRTAVGWNKFNTYCHTTSNTNPACNREAANTTTFKYPGVNEYGVESNILLDFSSATPAFCVNDTVSGSSPGTGTGTCRGNRMVTCWNAGAASGRNVGGCIFDTNSSGSYGDTVSGVADLNLGVCESFHDSLQYDRQTLKQDLQLVAALPNCPDDATSAAQCSTGGAIVGFSSHIYDISTPLGSWTGPLGLNGTACSAGAGAYVEVGYKGGVGGTFSWGAERKTYYSGTNVAFAVRAVKRSKANLMKAGYRRMGFTPSSFTGRDSANLGDCPYQATSSNDVAACDTETQVGFIGGYNGEISESYFFKASHNANKSGVAETEAFTGGPNYFKHNRIVDAIRVNGVSDWGDGHFDYNIIEGVNLGGTATPLFTCYSDNCVIRYNDISRVKVTAGFSALFGTTNNIWTGNRLRDFSYSYDRGIFEVRDALYTRIEDNDVAGSWAQAATGALLRIVPGAGGYHKPSVIFRANHGFMTIDKGIAPAAGPGAAVIIEPGNADTTRADAFQRIQISENDFRYVTASGVNGCFVWLEDDGADAASQVQEGWGNIAIYGNNWVGPNTPDILCKGVYRTSGVANDAANDTGPSAENTWPRLWSNTVNGVDALDVPHGWKAVASVPDSDTLAEGTKVKVSNGTAGCGHTTGVLTAGAVRISCTAHPNGAGDDGTWTAD